MTRTDIVLECTNVKDIAMPPGSNRPHRKKVKHYDNGEPHFLTFWFNMHLNPVRRGLVERAEVALLWRSKSMGCATASESAEKAGWQE